MSNFELLRTSPLGRLTPSEAELFYNDLDAMEFDFWDLVHICHMEFPKETKEGGNNEY